MCICKHLYRYEVTNAIFMHPLTGTRLRERRLGLGLRQGQVADLAGISPAYLNLIEHNRRPVAGDLLVRLAQVLNADAAALTGEAEAALADDLRQAAAGAGADGAGVQEFLARFPDWAGVLLAHAQRAAGLERAVAALNDRISHDPHLSATLHDMLTAATALRATAGILADSDAMEAPVQARFHRNLVTDSDRLAVGAAALVSYLDGAGQADLARAVTPQDEVEAWLASRDWTLTEAEAGGVDAAGIARLGSGTARALAHRLADLAITDAQAMPLGAFGAALAVHGPDPVRLAQMFGADVLAVCRRLAGLPRAGIGVVICDAAGALIYRRPVAGFAMPRAGAACALWPLFTALGRPMQPVEAVAETTTQPPHRFLLRAFCQTGLPAGFGGVELRHAAMLILPAPVLAPTPAPLVIGPTCRICPRDDCPARREPSILTG
jgi:transcriptional regulator with XRE-family HTH domain